jgi:hypothetical protein
MPAPDAYVAEIANKTSFDYIRDFLGYRIQLNGAYFPSNVSLGGTLSVAIRVTNFGFSAPINPRLVFLVLIDAATDAIVFITHFPGVDWRAWQPHVEQPRRGRHKGYLCSGAHCCPGLPCLSAVAPAVRHGAACAVLPGHWRVPDKVAQRPANGRV